MKKRVGHDPRGDLNEVSSPMSRIRHMLLFILQVVSKSALEDAKQLVLSAFDENNDGRIDIAEVGSGCVMHHFSATLLQFWT